MTTFLIVLATLVGIAAAGLLTGGTLKREPIVKAKPMKRPRPRSVEELARTAFDAARSVDNDAFRALLLNGQEAKASLGEEGAEEYLAGQTPKVVTAALMKLSRNIGKDGSFGGVPESEDEWVSLAVVRPDGATETLRLGTVTQVDGVHRLHTLG